eukprot:GEMP01035183.1.p2 GENE.GEMP01035183.1~~GEMP01035183.1.p2  ORF type:complete len:216 (-),score=31.70 GEMP01035183.1:1346-1993(-)
MYYLGLSKRDDKAQEVENVKTNWLVDSPGEQVEIFQDASKPTQEYLLNKAPQPERYALLNKWDPEKIPSASADQIKLFRRDSDQISKNIKKIEDEGNSQEKIELFKKLTPAEQTILYRGADKIFKLDLCPVADPSVQSELVNPTHEEAPTEVASTETSSAQPQSYLGSAQNTSGTTSCSRVPIVVAGVREHETAFQHIIRIKLSLYKEADRETCT